MQYEISEHAREKVNQHILISGCARSGTTIVGKLLHTFADVEFNHEPPIMFAMLPLINELPEYHFKLLYETYLYEDFFIDALCGRRINCNRGDDSSVWNVKSEQEVSRRLAVSIPKKDSEKQGVYSHIAYKLPDVTPYLADLKRIYPESRIVITRRSAVGTLSSMLEKSWFSDANAQSNLIWPFVQRNGFKIPYWVEPHNVDNWCHMSELDRCAYYYIRINQTADEVPDYFELKYSELLSDASKVATKLASQLGLSFGPRTQEVIDSIKPTDKDRDDVIFKKISEEFREQVRFYSERSE